MLCNACGLFLKLHGRPRPISLKTDVIKSRNRVKTAQPKKRDSADGQPMNGLAAAHPDVATQALNVHGHPQQTQQLPTTGGDPNSLSRSNTPGLSGPQNPNIAPQHIFDTVSLSTDAFASPSLPAFIRQPSPSASSINGNAATLEPPQTYDALQSQNQHYRTRVSELEVINDLFRGRVTELEQSEREARESERVKDEELERYKADLEAANTKVNDLQKRLAELEEHSTPARKRARRSGPEEANGEDEKS